MGMGSVRQCRTTVHSDGHSGAALPSSAFSDVKLVLEISHAGRIYTTETSCPPSLSPPYVRAGC